MGPGAYRKEAGGPAAQRHGQHVVEHVHVLAEAVEHAAHGRAVEEADAGRAQHAAQQRRVQRARRRQRAQVQRQRRHRHRHHCAPVTYCRSLSSTTRTYEEGELYTKVPYVGPYSFNANITVAFVPQR